VGLTRGERVRDLCEHHGAAWVESPSEMLARMSLDQRERLAGLRSEQTFLLRRGEPSQFLDPALAALGEMDNEMERRVAYALAGRRLARRALGSGALASPTAAGPRPTNVLSLCTGIGGLDIGLKITVPEARTACYVEVDQQCQELLVTRMGGGVLDAAPVWGDLKRLDAGRWRGVVDTVVGGYPCQPFSTAGRRRGAEDPRHLWPHISRIIRECEPQWCLFENVGGHLSLGAPDVVGDLVRMGFSVALGFFTAAELGAPHGRKRLFVLAHSGSHAHPPVQGGQTDADGHGGGRDSAEIVAGIAAMVGPRTWPPDARDPVWRDVVAQDPSLSPGVEEGGERRLNPAFVEWLMGFPRGWTEGHSQKARLHMLGNAVVPAAAALAWCELSAALERGTRKW
jgi:DNA (cytosine-5)-methyltransferase 1